MNPSWKDRVRALRLEAYALYLACRDPRVPWYARVFAGLVIAHTFSPIDLIPDFIPVLGYLDDLIVTPLGVFLALKMIPAEVMIDARRRAQALLDQTKPVSRLGLVIVVTVWLSLGLLAWLILRAYWLQP